VDIVRLVLLTADFAAVLARLVAAGTAGDLDGVRKVVGTGIDHTGFLVRPV
jgi:hypothetical protein